MSDDTRYGWTCESRDDERMECPFDSVEAALDDAKATIEEEAGDSPYEWEPGSREVDVCVSRVAPYRAFDPERILDDVISRMADDGLWDEPDEVLHLDTSARNVLRDAMQAAWDAHVERERVPLLWEATHGPTRHKITVTIAEPQP